MSDLVPLTIAPRRVKLRVEDYLALDALGAFAAYGRTELIDGEVVHMNAQHRPHARVKSRLHVRIAAALRDLGSDMEALVEASVAMPPHDVPEPDIAITAEPEGDGLIPLPSLALVIEVADATIADDLGRKRRLYAQAGVPEYWVVDLNARLIHQMWSPAGDDYAERRRIAFGDRIDAATLPGLGVATTAL